MTLDREFSSLIGGGIAPLPVAALMAWFSSSWTQVTGYLSRPMVPAVGGSRMVSRDL